MLEQMALEVEGPNYRGMENDGGTMGATGRCCLVSSSKIML
jgi:hypothetical protein